MYPLADITRESRIGISQTWTSTRYSFKTFNQIYPTSFLTVIGEPSNAVKLDSFQSTLAPIPM